MADALKNPRIQELLRELGEAQELATRIGPSVDLDETIERLHRDLGKALAQFARVHASHTLLPPDPGPLATEDLYTDDGSSDDDGDNDWYDDGAPAQPGTLFDPGDLDDETDIPESDPVPKGADDDDDDEPDVETVARMQQRRADPGSPMGQLTAASPPTWLHHVTPFRDLLTLPEDPNDADALAVEATKVQWATGELITRLDGLPSEIQTCFIGMLAARCQWLVRTLEVDVGPRLSLDRLQRYRLSADLPPVAGLEPSPRPEYGTWAEDARQWFAVLDTGGAGEPSS